MTYNAICRIKVDEAQVNLMTRDSTPIIQPNYELMLDEKLIGFSHTPLQSLINLLKWKPLEYHLPWQL